VEDYRLELLGYNRERFERERDERFVAWQAMKRMVEDPSVPNTEKHNLQCEFALKYGGLTFNTNPTAWIFCRGCFLKQHCCVCSRWNKGYTPSTRVIVHMHHAEWGRGSNTGIILAESLRGCEVLIKGHKEHDNTLQDILQDPGNLVAMLWPGGGALEPGQLVERVAQHPGKRLVVIVIDATWKAATNMAHRLPGGVCKVVMPPGASLFAEGYSVSLLSPIRMYRGSFEESGRVSTLEAVAALLCALGEPTEIRDGLLQNLKVKVDSMLVQKGLPTVYGTA